MSVRKEESLSDSRLSLQKKKKTEGKMNEYMYVSKWVKVVQYEGTWFLDKIIIADTDQLKIPRDNVA